MDIYSSLSLNKIWEMLQTHCMIQKVTCAQSVSFLHNSEMIENASCAQSVYFL